MIEAKTRLRNEATGVAPRLVSVRVTDTSGRGAADGGERGAEERGRAVRYLDLWERHVAGAAVGGNGIAAPWFSR
jgi:hypothetical protein